jgi:hypothetical protein
MGRQQYDMDQSLEALVGATSLTSQPMLHRLVLSCRETGTSLPWCLNADCPEMHTEAQGHSEAEAKMALWKGIETYPQAAAWFILLSSTIIMEGYNSNLIGSLFAYPAFAQKCDGAIIRP